MVYKVEVMQASNVAGLEAMLNSYNEQGYALVHIYNVDSRVAVVFKLLPQRGRPKKETSESSLGE